MTPIPVICGFTFPAGYEFSPDNTVNIVDLTKAEIPQCPLVLMDDNKSIFFPMDVNTNAIITFNMAYDTAEMNFELLYGAFLRERGRLVQFHPFSWRKDIARHGQGGSHIIDAAQVNVPRNTIWQIGFQVSRNVANNILIHGLIISFEPWASSPGKPARR